MKTVNFLLLFSAVSLTAMVLIDYAIGEKAEFLNAFSAAQRLLGQVPTIGESLIAKKFGAAGEFFAVSWQTLR